MSVSATAHRLAWLWIFTKNPFVTAPATSYVKLDVPEIGEWNRVLDPEPLPKTIMPVSPSKGLTPSELKAQGPKVERPVPASTCICENDPDAVWLYRSYELGIELSEWQQTKLEEHVAVIEAQCPATTHYGRLALDEALGADVTLDTDEPPRAIADFYDLIDSDHAMYMRRTEETGGRWIEQYDGSGLTLDRDDKDWQTKIRAHEMAKKRELAEKMLAEGLGPHALAPWVKRCIEFKRRDAITEHKLAAAKAERDAREGEYIAAPAIVSESQVRLRAYSYCLDFLRRGKRPPEARIDPEMAARIAWLDSQG